VEAVCQLYQDYADIAHHREQHLSHAFGLASLARVQFELSEFRYAIDAPGYLGPEPLLDILESGRGIFEHIMQQCRLQAHKIHLHVGEDACNS
jgi:hypothetical protein